MRSTTPVIAEYPKHFSYSVKSDSVDQAIKDMRVHPKIVELLKTSNLGTEYLTIEYNHGDEVYITIHK